MHTAEMASGKMIHMPCCSVDIMNRREFHCTLLQWPQVGWHTCQVSWQLI
jgi:hypothetical protein